MGLLDGVKGVLQGIGQPIENTAEGVQKGINGAVSGVEQLYDDSFVAHIPIAGSLIGQQLHFTGGVIKGVTGIFTGTAAVAGMILDGNFEQFVGQFAHDPKAMLKAMWDAGVKSFEQDPADFLGQAAGQIGFAAVTMGAGTAVDAAGDGGAVIANASLLARTASKLDYVAQQGGAMGTAAKLGSTGVKATDLGLKPLRFVNSGMGKMGGKVAGWVGPRSLPEQFQPGVLRQLILKDRLAERAQALGLSQQNVTEEQLTQELESLKAISPGRTKAQKAAYAQAQSKVAAFEAATTRTATVQDAVAALKQIPVPDRAKELIAAVKGHVDSALAVPRNPDGTMAAIDRGTSDLGGFAVPNQLYGTLKLSVADQRLGAQAEALGLKTEQPTQELIKEQVGKLWTQADGKGAGAKSAQAKLQAWQQTLLAPVTRDEAVKALGTLSAAQRAQLLLAQLQARAAPLINKIPNQVRQPVQMVGGRLVRFVEANPKLSGMAAVTGAEVGNAIAGSGVLTGDNPDMQVALPTDAPPAMGDAGGLGAGTPGQGMTQDQLQQIVIGLAQQAGTDPQTMLKQLTQAAQSQGMDVPTFLQSLMSAAASSQGAPGAAPNDPTGIGGFGAAGGPTAGGIPAGGVNLPGGVNVPGQYVMPLGGAPVIPGVNLGMMPQRAAAPVIPGVNLGGLPGAGAPAIGGFGTGPAPVGFPIGSSGLPGGNGNTGNGQ